MNTTEQPAARMPVEVVYEALSERCVMLNELLWQAPVVSLTAQAFLLTIAYGDTPRTHYRILAGLIAAVIGLASWQLFLRHAAYERAIAREMREIEEKHFGRPFHAPLRETREGAGLRGPAAWRSRPIWAACLFGISFGGVVPVVEWLAGTL